MESIVVETLLTMTGIVLVTGIIVQAVKVVVPDDKLSAQVLRTAAMVIAVVLTIVVGVATGVPEGTNAVLFWIVVVVNGLIAGLAASAAFDTAKYGVARVVSKPE